MTFGPGSMPISAVYKLLQSHRTGRDLANGHKTKLKENRVLGNAPSIPWKRNHLVQLQNGGWNGMKSLFGLEEDLLKGIIKISISKYIKQEQQQELC